MAIELKRVTENLRSVLVLSDYHLNNYQECLMSLKWLKENKASLPDAIKRACTKAIQHSFFQVFSSYLFTIGLTVREGVPAGDPSVYLREDDTVDVYCEGIKVMQDRKDCLDGFVPELTFFINPKNTSEIEVTAQLKQEGAYLLSSLIPLTFLQYLPGQNGLNSPIIKPSRVNYLLSIASIAQISRFLKDMKTIYQSIEKGKLEKINQIKGQIDLMPEEFKETARANYALAILRTLEKQI
jgi:hypothetical protein